MFHLRPLQPVPIARVQEPVRPVAEAPVGGDGGGHCCTKCGAPGVRPHYHRDSAACQIARFGIFRADEHLHFKCDVCGYDFTSPVLTDTRSNKARL